MERSGSKSTCILGSNTNNSVDQAEKARGATQRGTLSAYTFLMRNFMLIPKIFGKRALPDANGSYGRGYGR